MSPLSPPPDRSLLIHGAATTPRVWRLVVEALPDWSLAVPERTCSGDLGQEVAALAPAAAGAVVGGVSGGATLGLAMLAAGVPMAGAVLHEPAVGSLLPGLLAPVAAAFAAGGVPSFGAALYGPAWTPAEAPADLDRVARDLAMFRLFEPTRLPEDHPPVLLTVGELSPPIRHQSVRALADYLGLTVEVVPDTSHAVHLEAPEAFAGLLRRCVPRVA